jgi:hypothetical protein
MFPDMWSRSITAIALWVTIILGALAALPAPAPGWAPASDGLMRALEQAPIAVATWKRTHEHRRPAVAGRPGKRAMKSQADPFRKPIFVGLLDHRYWMTRLNPYDGDGPGRGLGC